MGKRVLVILSFFFLLCPAVLLPAAGNPNDSEGSNDPPIFSRMPGFHIYRSEEIDFDRYEFQVGPDQKEAVEGRHFLAVYYADDGTRIPSALQIVRNYVNAATAIGGQKMYDFEDGGQLYVILKVVHKDAEAWAEVQAGGNGIYVVHLVEKQLMNQAVVANAESLAGSIRETGKAAVYGIYFDSGKTEVKPESEPALKEIAGLIRSDPNLKLYVVGHTDNVGAFDYNLKLSKDRAVAVVNALVEKYDIPASLLKPYGDGPTAPVASNATDEGRAKNRRVELVAQ